MSVPIPESFDLESENVGDYLRVTIVRPPGSAAGAKPPVVFAFDPAFISETVVAAAHWLPLASRIAGGSIPDSIVVTVGYRSEEPAEVMARRARDLTPTAGEASPIPLPPLPLGFGGAGRFLDALIDEVIPEVVLRCPEGGDSRMLAGWSFGGLFVLYTLFHRPESFQGYLAISPSIWWDGRVLLQYEQAWVDHHEDLSARVFLAVGGREQDPGGGWQNEGFPDEAIAAVQQVTNVKELSSRLSGRGYRSLELESVVLEGEYHLTVPAAALTRGLLWLLS